MGKHNSHTKWLKRVPKKLESIDGTTIEVFELSVDDGDQATLTEWARHFREHYCLDTQLDQLRKGTNKSRAEYLLDLVFPDKTDDFGPATRAGDFAEILLSDLLEKEYGYWVPRLRYNDKLVRNESSKGTDVLGIRFHSDNSDKPSKRDTLIALESKAQMSGSKLKPRLQEAINDSSKDAFRLAETLNAMKRRLLARNQKKAASKIERFQNGIETPYIRKSGAAAVLCSSLFDPKKLSKGADCSGHENGKNLVLIVVHSDALMSFVHSLYGRAADEA